MWMNNKEGAELLFHRDRKEVIIIIDTEIKPLFGVIITKCQKEAKDISYINECEMSAKVLIGQT